MVQELIGTVTVRFVTDSGECFHVTGQRSHDHLPASGCDLDEGKEDVLREWLIKISVKKERDSIKKKTCCGEEWSYIDAPWSEARCHKCGGVLNERI